MTRSFDPRSRDPQVESHWLEKFLLSFTTFSPSIWLPCPFSCKQQQNLMTSSFARILFRTVLTLGRTFSSQSLSFWIYNSCLLNHRAGGMGGHQPLSQACLSGSPVWDPSTKTPPQTQTHCVCQSTYWTTSRCSHAVLLSSGTTGGRWLCQAPV